MAPIRVWILILVPYYLFWRKILRPILLICFCVRYLRFLYFTFFWVPHDWPTTGKQTAAGQSDSSNRLRPAAVDHAPPSASDHRSRSMVGGGGGWHGWQRPIECCHRQLFLHYCGSFFCLLGVRSAVSAGTKILKLKGSYFKNMVSSDFSSFVLALA